MKTWRLVASVLVVLAGCFGGASGQTLTTLWQFYGTNGLARLGGFEGIKIHKSLQIKPGTQKVFTTPWRADTSPAAVTRGGGCAGRCSRSWRSSICSSGSGCV